MKEPLQASSSVPRRVFDSLYIHALIPDPVLVARLREVGFDLTHPEERYPTRVWRDALEVTRAHLYPHATVAEGFRALGRRFLNGFLDTAVGRVFASGTSSLGPERVLVRLPSFLSLVRDDLELTIQPEGDDVWRASVRDDHPAPEFSAGVVEAIIDNAQGQAVVEVSRFEGREYDLRVRWIRGRER